MTRKGILAAALILALSGASWKSATAAPITYTISFTASGTLDGQPFYNDPVQIIASSDTERVVATRDNKLLVATTATFGHRDNPTQIAPGAARHRRPDGHARSGPDRDRGGGVGQHQGPRAPARHGDP